MLLVFSVKTAGLAYNFKYVKTGVIISDLRIDDFQRSLKREERLFHNIESHIDPDNYKFIMDLYFR